MCPSIRGLLLGCLIFSIIYVVAGSVQVTVGVVFMIVLPIFRLASNIWTGIANVILGFAMSGLICCGPTSVAKHKVCMGLSLTVVLVNLVNLLVLEICEWRAFLPNIRIQDIMRDQKTDLLLAAYLTSTISTAVALVIGFVACEYIYCLLIAGSTNDEEEEDKPSSLKRTFPCRTRRASSYEPISFSWVFEASDNFHSGQNSLMKPLVSPQPLNTVDLIPKPKLISNTTVQNNINCQGVGASGVVGGTSKSSSGYSSPDGFHQHGQNNLAEKRNRFRSHYENIEFFHLSTNRMHLSQDNVTAKKLDKKKPERDVRSLVQLPTCDTSNDVIFRGISSTSVCQSTLPLRGHRKRSLSDSKGRRPEGKSPRKRHKTDSLVDKINETTSFVDEDPNLYRRVRLSSTPETNKKPSRLPEVPNMSTIVCVSPEEELPSSKAINASGDFEDDAAVIDITAHFHATPELGTSPTAIKNLVSPMSNGSAYSGSHNPSMTTSPHQESDEEVKEEPADKSSNEEVLHEIDELINKNGLPPIKIEIHKDNEESQSTWKLFRKPSWNDLEKSKYSKSDDGIVFRSLDRRLKDKYLESGYGENMERKKLDSSAYWKPMDRPQLNPLFLDDCDSLVNLSNLELLARQWRTCHLHEQMRKQISSRVKRIRNEASNHDDICI